MVTLGRTSSEIATAILYQANFYFTKRLKSGFDVPLTQGQGSSRGGQWP